MNFLPRQKHLYLGTILSVILSSPATAQVEVVRNVDFTSNPVVRPFTETPLEDYQLVWSDEFNGEEINLNKWYYRTDSKLWSTQLPANNEVREGYYHIFGRKQKAMGKEYTGGGMISKKLFKYGFYETRMKVPDGEGWHTSFWMMRHVELRDVPVDGVHIELDVVENDSSDLYYYQTDAHSWRPGSHRKYGTKHHETAESLAEFHVYGMEFTPERLRYYFDGKLVSETDASVFPHNAVNIWLTCLAGKLGRKTEKVDDSLLPALAQFDYVRFFQRESVTIGITQPEDDEIIVTRVGESIDLTAKVTVNPPEVKPVVLWSTIFGQGVLFSDEYNISTQATFSTKGKFILEFSAKVGSVTETDRVTVYVE